jgi:dGTPase
MTEREQFESWHDSFLAPWALHERDSGGREYPQDEHPYRTSYSRDRDRIVHCSAFRRLDYKTQVFVPHEQDHYRTRLTHSLEVAQIARTLARALRANEDVCEAVALAHDLGHPPFGHDGEAVLDELMAEHGHFEHNRQSLRVVEHLEHPYPQFRGLNLTWAVRCCLAKHSTRYDAPAGAAFDACRQAPLEGQLVDLADEIAYTSADTADALAAGWIAHEHLLELALYRRAWETAAAAMPQASPVHKRIRACGNLLALLTDNALAATAQTLGRLNPADCRAVMDAPAKLAGLNENLRRELDQLQQFLMEKVYLHPKGQASKDQARRSLRELFLAFIAHPEELPDRYRRRIDQQGPHRVVCDYVAGMTDRFCILEHRRICGGSGSSPDQNAAE